MDGSCRFIPRNSVTYNDSRGYLARNMNQTEQALVYDIHCAPVQNIMTQNNAPTPIAELNPPTTDPGIPMAQWLNT